MLDEGCILAPGQKLSNRRHAAEVGGKARNQDGKFNATAHCHPTSGRGN
jgi:integrase